MTPSSSKFKMMLVSVMIVSSCVMTMVEASEASSGQCLSDPELNAMFATDEPTCCQYDVCGLPCPTQTSPPELGTYYSVES